MNGFADIIGQDRAIEWLRQAFVADRLPHGLVFAGPVGVGKATTAKALAALFLCDKPTGANACGACPSCRVFAAGNHPDYHVVYRQLIRSIKAGPQVAQSLSIDVIRDFVLGPANHKTVMGRGKVFLIEEADTMNPAAQNGMLKTLEEPFGRTLVVLITDQPDSLLPTIRSRCQLVRFGSLPADLVEARLRQNGISAADAKDAADIAAGSLGLALRWREDGVIDAARQLRQRLSTLLAGRAVPDLADWLKVASTAYAKKQVERDADASEPQATRDGLAIFLHLAASAFRAELARTEDSTRLHGLCAAIDAILLSEGYLGANVNIPLIFQQLTVTLEGISSRSLRAAG